MPAGDTGAHWESGATRPSDAQGLQYHIRCRTGDLGRYVLLPGDPERVPLIARYWPEAREVARHREYTSYAGRLDDGTPIAAVSTGIGGPSTAIAVEELSEIGCDTFIRVGTTGAIQPHIACGDLVIVTGAVRFDGTSDEYVDPAFPAVAHHEVVLALIEAAERLQYRYHVGICASTASFHCGQSRPGFGGYTQTATPRRLEDLRRAGVLSFEMEAATLFTLSALFGPRHRAGAVLAVVANRATDEMRYAGVEASARTAVEAVRILSDWDRRVARSGKARWHPTIGERAQA